MKTKKTTTGKPLPKGPTDVNGEEVTLHCSSIKEEGIVSRNDVNQLELDGRGSLV